jgi:hypothetical protein
MQIARNSLDTQAGPSDSLLAVASALLLYAPSSVARGGNAERGTRLDVERVGSEGGGRVLADRPADHTAAECVARDGAVHLALTGQMVRDAEVHPEASRRGG